VFELQLCGDRREFAVAMHLAMRPLPVVDVAIGPSAYHKPKWCRRVRKKQSSNQRRLQNRVVNSNVQDQTFKEAVVVLQCGTGGAQLAWRGTTVLYLIRKDGSDART
jgi:hypothetical protein